MKARREVIAATAKRYQRARKGEKGRILDEFVETTGYSRWHASYVLRWHERPLGWVGGAKLVSEVRVKERRRRQPFYDEKTVVVLKKIWEIMDYICGKRLAPVLGEMVVLLAGRGEIECDIETLGKLSQVSAATIDRLLRDERKKYELKGRSGTRPGSLLKHQIPIRTFSDWDENRPGFVEADLVSHDGGIAAGEFCHTLDMTDIATTWTETAAVRNKAQENVFAAITELRGDLPFPLLGLDSDNGGEFINNELERYCRAEEITFTRSRPLRKNDSCFVEQKNWSVVRRAVGYARYDTQDQCDLLNELYGYLRLYTNFFMPSMKLVSRERHGSRVTKRYDRAQTPYQRVLSSEDVADEVKRELKAKRDKLNPAALKRQIEYLQSKLYKSASRLDRVPAQRRRASGLASGRQHGAWQAGM